MKTPLIQLLVFCHMQQQFSVVLSYPRSPMPPAQSSTVNPIYNSMQESISGNNFSRAARLLILALLPAFLCLNACREDDSMTRPYPRIKTLEVTSINESGALFQAELLLGNKADILEYGFVWDTYENLLINTNEKSVTIGSPQENLWNAYIHYALQRDELYFVKAWVKTSKFTIYGNPVTFRSLGSLAPVITGFTPMEGTAGDTLLINGKNFSYKTHTILVNAGLIRASLVSSTDTTIRIIVPPAGDLDKVFLSVSFPGYSCKSTEMFSYLD